MDFPLFAYGTLKSGFPAHTRWCRGTRKPISARCDGALRLHSDGYPVLFIRPETALAIGGSDVLADAAIAHRPPRLPRVRDDLARDDCARTEVTAGVHGELLVFPHRALPLSELDAYECFTPGAPSLFVRVLVTVELLETRERRHAWTYVAGRLMDGAGLANLGDRWPAR